MGVVQAQIETVEEISRLVWTAVANKQPIEAMYQERHRLFFLAPHRLGRNREGRLRLLSIWRRKRTPAGRFPAKLAVCCAGETQQGEVRACSH